MAKLFNYYFTFGQNHSQRDGTPMKDYWIRVVADSYMTARAIFIHLWSYEYMPKVDMWSFQYDDNSFEKHYFPKGEYLCIEQTPEIMLQIAALSEKRLNENVNLPEVDGTI